MHQSQEFGAVLFQGRFDLFGSEDSPPGGLDCDHLGLATLRYLDQQQCETPADRDEDFVAGRQHRGHQSFDASPSRVVD